MNVLSCWVPGLKNLHVLRDLFLQIQRLQRSARCVLNFTDRWIAVRTPLQKQKKVQQDLESRWDNFGREFAAQEPTFRAFNHFQWHGIWIKEHFESLQSIESPNHTRRNVAGNTSPCECCATFESFRFGFSSISVISIHIPHNVKTKIKVGKLTTWTEWT